MRTKSVHDQEGAEYGIARSVEMTPIMITDSEDEAETFLDDKDAELQASDIIRLETLIMQILEEVASEGFRI